MPFVVGETVGAYRLTEQLGQGGMATVFKAYHAALDRYVAIKALHPFFQLDENTLVRFRREARVVARMENPNIIPVYDYSEHEDRPYLVMKYVKGETLKARLSRGPIGPDDLERIVVSVGNGLSYAHEHGVLHRDVKPSNVMMAEDGRIYLSDFGLARIAQAGESTLSADVMLGTPQYISPEQAKGESELDNGTDIYSFGVMLYELVVGRVPYSADTPFAVIHDHIYKPLPLPSLENPDITEPVERFLLKALAKDRSDRFEDIPAMLDAWKASCDADSSPAPKPSMDTVILAFDEGGAPEPETQAVEEVGLPESQGKETTPEDAAGSSGTKSNRFWVGLFSGVLLVILVIIGAIFVLRRINNRVDKQLDQQGQQETSQPVRPVGRSSGDPFARGPQATAMSVEEASRIVRENPENVEAYLGLAHAHLNNGELAKAESSLRDAEQLVGDPYRFYLLAGDYLFNRQSWLLASRMYLNSFEFGPEPKPEVFDRINQSLYLAVRGVGAMTMVEKSSAKYIRPEILEIVSARRSLYKGDTKAAQEIVVKLNREGTDLPELALLQAEIYIKTGEPELAREYLTALSEDENAAPWVREFAKFLLTGLAQ